MVSEPGTCFWLSADFNITFKRSQVICVAIRIAVDRYILKARLVRGRVQN